MFMAASKPRFPSDLQSSAAKASISGSLLRLFLLMATSAFSGSKLQIAI